MWDTRLNWTKVRASLFILIKAFSIFLALAKLKLYHLCTSPHRNTLRNSRSDRVASIP